MIIIMVPMTTMMEECSHKVSNERSKDHQTERRGTDNDSNDEGIGTLLSCLEIRPQDRYMKLLYIPCMRSYTIKGCCMCILCRRRNYAIADISRSHLNSVQRTWDEVSC